MYAVFVCGGKQYRAKTGDTLQVELLDHNMGATTDFKEVLLVGEGAEVKIGQPIVASASVTAEVIAIEKGPKIVVYQKKRRKQYDKKTGHRQAYTRLLVTAINDGAGKNATLSAADRTKLMSNIGFTGDEWIEDDIEVTAEIKSPLTPMNVKKAATDKAAAKKAASAKTAAKKASPKAAGAARTASPKKKA